MNDATDICDPIIKFDKVVKRFGDHVVLDELDFEVQRGEKVTIIGPSGSGKSTVLRILMTLEKINDGVVYVGGEPLWHQRKGESLEPAGEQHLRQMRSHLGMVFQQFNLFPHMTVLRNLTEAPVQVLGVSKAEARKRGMELLEMVGLTDQADKYPHQLSGGQQQR
ncbi:MAG: amino acid ABC transporter ATP-binding protein, partial [Salinicola sp.]